jgi:predicted nucleic acid-binding protein
MKRLAIYIDTSVINQLLCDDAPDLKKITQEFFFRQESHSHFSLFISPIVIDEISRTKDEKKKHDLMTFVHKLKLDIIDLESIQDEILRMAAVYMEKGIIPKNKIEDALHIAITTISELDILLSWNFRHLANINKELKIQAVNITEGYTKQFRMITPMEVLDDDT